MKVRIGAGLVVALISGLGIAPAIAGPCADDVARLERSLQRHPGEVGTAPQSVDAQLEHQPTPVSVESAEHKARNEVASVLAQAKALDAEGKPNECLAALAKAKLLLNP